MELVDKSKAWVVPKLEWLRASWQEVRHKVTWPTKQEVVGTTRVVLIAVVVFAIIVGLMDFTMFHIVERLFSLFQ